jgi:hypothetical protein
VNIPDLLAGVSARARLERKALLNLFEFEAAAAALRIKSTNRFD